MIIKAFSRKTAAAALLAISIFSAAVIVTPSVINTAAKPAQEEKKFIKWVEFNVTAAAMEQAYKIDLKAHEEGKSASWTELLAYLGARYGGDFSRYRADDLKKLTEQLDSGKTMEEITSGMKYYPYYREAYGAVLDGFVGEFSIETADGDGKSAPVKKYGLKVFSPIARGYSYSHFDDFGSSRSYGYRRKHLGHDLMGGIGTPIIAVESGTVEAAGWNQYGGWRIGIRSFDKKRYYYYAHLRKDHPYCDIYEGQTVTAGDCIGYLGMTGYSSKENVNNINTPHLHYGLQLIFDESQKDGSNEIWIDMYEITKFLETRRSEVVKDKESGEYYRKYQLFEKNTEE